MSFLASNFSSIVLVSSSTAFLDCWVNWLSPFYSSHSRSTTLALSSSSNTAISVVLDSSILAPDVCSVNLVTPVVKTAEVAINGATRSTHSRDLVCAGISPRLSSRLSARARMTSTGLLPFFPWLPARLSSFCLAGFSNIKPVSLRSWWYLWALQCPWFLLRAASSSFVTRGQVSSYSFLISWPSVLNSQLCSIKDEPCSVPSAVSAHTINSAPVIFSLGYSVVGLCIRTVESRNSCRFIQVEAKDPGLESLATTLHSYSRWEMTLAVQKATGWNLSN